MVYLIQECASNVKYDYLFKHRLNLSIKPFIMNVPHVKNHGPFHHPFLHSSSAVHQIEGNL